jgi:Ras-related protein Rab-5C
LHAVVLKKFRFLTGTDHLMQFGPEFPLFRVVTLGEASVGKTSIVTWLVKQTFNPDEPSTIGASFVVHTETVNTSRIEMQIWDTAGQEKYKSLCPIYCRGAAAAIVVFDLTSQPSFEKVATWTALASRVAGTDTVIYIAANKLDKTADREVSDDTLASWSQQVPFPVFRTSAKTGEGITELFRALGRALYEKEGSGELSTQLALPGVAPRSSSCCQML